MRRYTNIIASALAAFCLLFAPSAWAQTLTSGAIQGVVVDESTGENLAGVTVVATSPALQGTQTALTDRSGFYRITNLPPGLYVVTFYFADITVRRSNVEISVNRTTPVHARVDTSKAGGEVIEIRERAPTIDPTSTNQGITIDQDYIRNIPVPGRTFEGQLAGAAGAQPDDLGISFSGSTSLENQYVIDGVNTTGLTFGNVGSPLITSFIQEIDVITGGYQAEYGRSTGGVVNVVTRQGSNEFRGEVFNFFSSGIFRATPQRIERQGSPVDFETDLTYDFNFGFTLGGPIIKDKLWFFVGFAPRLQQFNITKITKRLTDCRQVNPDGTLTVPDDRPCTPEEAQMFGDGSPDRDPETGFFIFEELDRTKKPQINQEFQFVSKINYALAPEHQGQVSFIGIPLIGERLGAAGEPRAANFDFQALTTDLAAKWTSKFNDNKTEVEGLIGWHRSTFNVRSIESEADDIPRQNLVFGTLGEWSMLGHESQRTFLGCRDSSNPAEDIFPFIDNCPDAGVGYAVGGPGVITDNVEDRKSARLAVTQRVTAAGNHQIKGGVDIEDNNLTDLRKVSGDVFYTAFIGNQLTGGRFDQLNATRFVQLAPPDSTDPRFGNVCGFTDASGPGEVAEPIPCDFRGPGIVQGNTLNWSAFLQDSWQILPNLTMNAGIRYEEQRLRFADFLRGSTDPLTGKEFTTNAMILRNMWAPRVGLLYDWTKEGRSKVYGSWGRFYESIPLNINDRSFGGEAFYVQRFGFASCGDAVPGYGAPDGNNCAGDPTSDTLFGSGVLVAPGVKPQFLDEYIIGAEYEVLEDLRLGVAYKTRRIGRILEDVSTDNADTYIIANPGEWPDSEEQRLRDAIANEMDPGARALLEAQLDQFLGIRQFDKAVRNYNAVELTALRRFARDLYMQGSYTYAQTIGNYPGLYSPDNRQVDPNISSQFDLIELLANRYGPLPQDRRHTFRVEGWKHWQVKDFGQILTGGRVRSHSGKPNTALGAHFLYGSNESFLLPRGAMGRTPWFYNVDLRLGYQHKLARGMELQVFADLFRLMSIRSQATFDVDQRYTSSPSNPVVGGSYEDLVFAKRNALNTGAETSDPVLRNPNFMNTTVRFAPFEARFGAQLTF